MKSFKATCFLMAATSLLCLAGCAGEKTTPGSVLTEKKRQFIRDTLAGMRDEVELLAFVDRGKAGARLESFSRELAALQGKVIQRSYDIDKDKETAASYGVSRAPVAVLKKGSVSRMRFFGLPEGHEFPVFIETIDRLSRGAADLSAAAVGRLADLKVPITFKVFTTPS